jgi:hypothetical protein
LVPLALPPFLKEGWGGFNPPPQSPSTKGGSWKRWVIKGGKWRRNLKKGKNRERIYKRAD